MMITWMVFIMLPAGLAIQLITQAPILRRSRIAPLKRMKTLTALIKCLVHLKNSCLKKLRQAVLGLSEAGLTSKRKVRPKN